MPESYRFTQSLSWTEYVSISLYMLQRHRLIRRLFLFVFIIALLSSLLTLGAHGENEVVSAWSLLMPVIAGPLILAAFFVVVILLFSLFVVKFKPGLVKDIGFHFTHSGMARTAGKSDISIPWKDFEQMKETKNFIFLFARVNAVEHVYPIRKGNFGNALDLEEFKRFVEEKRPLQIFGKQ